MIRTGTQDLPIAFGPDGLVPAVIRDEASGDVLMVGFLNPEALQRTRETGLVHYWSRRRQKLWLKGETSWQQVTHLADAPCCRRPHDGADRR